MCGISLVYQLSAKQSAMKKYIVNIDSKTPDLYKNEMESLEVHAVNYKDAMKAGRRLARQEQMKFISVRVKK